MKVQYFVVVLSAALGLALSLPAKKEEQTTEKDLNKEVDFVPLDNKAFNAFPPGGVIDVDAGSFFDNKNFGRNPFSSAFDGVEAAFTRMRQLLNDLLGRIPTEPSDVPDFPELHIPNFGNVDLGKGNTTSVTKVINGHKVTINDTEYKSDEANGSSFFKVHIVEVHPDVAESSTKNNIEPVSPTKGEPESVEESLTNEIPKIKDNEGSKLDDNIETLDQADEAAQPFGNQQWNKFTDIESFDDNRIDSAPLKPYDLSRDTYVNQLLADSGATTNPDAEVFEPVGGRVPSGPYYSEVRAAPSGIAPYNFYPGNMYEQQENHMQPFRNPTFYAPSMMNPTNNPYYNRFQPEQIMVVPLNSNAQSYYAPLPIQPTSSLSQGTNSNTQTVLSSAYSNEIPDKTPSARSTT